MSSQNLPNSAPSLDLRKGFIVVGATVGLLVILVVCRFWFNVLVIDICILRDFQQARQQLKQIAEFIMPWRRRRRRETEDAQNGGSSAEPSQPRIEVEVHQASLGSLLSGMSSTERDKVLESILTRKIITEEDLASWREIHQDVEEAKDAIDDDDARHDPLDGHSMMCSICLHDLEIGDDIVSTKVCRHIFHSGCIIQWIESNGACPYCRTELIVPEDIRTR